MHAVGVLLISTIVLYCLQRCYNKGFYVFKWFYYTLIIVEIYIIILHDMSLIRMPKHKLYNVRQIVERKI